MSIEEKAKEFAGYDRNPTPDIITEIKMVRIRDDFKAGAEWMLEKVMSLISEISDGFGRSKDAETFRKILEE